MKISIKAARINAGLKQSEVANYVHRNKITLSRWENGKCDIPMTDFRKLCNLYQVKENDIFLPLVST